MKVIRTEAPEELRILKRQTWDRHRGLSTFVTMLQSFAQRDGVFIRYDEANDIWYYEKTIYGNKETTTESDS